MEDFAENEETREYQLSADPFVDEIAEAVWEWATDEQVLPL